MPCVTSAYLIKREVMEDRSTLPEYYNEVMERARYSQWSHLNFFQSFDIDEAFCLSLLEKGVFMHLNNQKTFGHVLNMEDNDINPNRLHNELWQMTKNRLDWEMRYICVTNINFLLSFASADTSILIIHLPVTNRKPLRSLVLMYFGFHLSAKPLLII